MNESRKINKLIPPAIAPHNTNPDAREHGIPWLFKGVSKAVKTQLSETLEKQLKKDLTKKLEQDFKNKLHSLPP